MHNKNASPRSQGISEMHSGLKDVLKHPIIDHCPRRRQTEGGDGEDTTTDEQTNERNLRATQRCQEGSQQAASKTARSLARSAHG